MKFIITVDTEADNQWVLPSTLSINNLKHVPRFQKLCDQYNLPVTYLITHEVASSKFAKELFSPWIKNDSCEIGSHLHPWSYNKKSSDVVRSHPYPFEFNFEDLEVMLESLTTLIKDTFNINPVSYRAGRYGICAKQINILAKLGYKIDSSVTPNINWGNNGQRFKRFRNDIYEIDTQNIMKAGNSGMYEAPLTTFKNPNFRKRIKGLLKGGNTFVQFRITPNISLDDLKNYIKKAINTKKEYVMLILHSSELMPGGSPYFETEASIEKMYNQYEALFQHITESKVRGLLLKDLIGEE